MAIGRPQKPHTCSWVGSDGKQVVIPGLYHCPDGRWRINAIGQKFTEKDERRAVQRFLDWQRQNSPPGTVSVQVEYVPALSDLRVAEPTSTANGTPLPVDIVDTLATQPLPDGHPEPALRIGYDIPESVIWPWLRELFINDAAYVAKQTGLPELAGYRNFAPPAPPIKLNELIEVYERENPSTGKYTKRRCVQLFEDMMRVTNAVTLADLTTDALMQYKRAIENDPEIESAQTKVWMYGQVKNLIAFGLKVGMDQGQISGALARCQVLWTPQAMPMHRPKPISREDFHALLKHANEQWRAWLLVGLNLCLHMDEVCGLECSEFDLNDGPNGTYATIRNKTRRRRIPRAAVLWAETLAAIRPFYGKAYLFTSPRGTRYNSNSRCNLFTELREKAGVTKVTFDWVRDGAYTASCRGQSNEQMSKLMAGHESGMTDRYALRDPAAVAPACAAVYAAYGPFKVA